MNMQFNRSFQKLQILSHFMTLLWLNMDFAHPGSAMGFLVFFSG